MTQVEVVSVNVSEHKGTVKRPVEQITVDSLGVVGDAHAGHWHRQVSLLSVESAERFAAELGRTIAPGEFGENITLRGLPPARGAAGPLRLRRGGTGDYPDRQVVSRRGCAIFREVGKCVMPAEGLFARVAHGGTIRPSDRGEHHPRPFTCEIITLSDRAAAGEYQDRSGPRIKELLGAFFATRRWRPAITSRVLRDDAEQLRMEVIRAKQCGVDVVFTTGGTGVGPRDITPETLAPLCDRLMPGIMEHIRAKHSPTNPRARLSRSIAGVAGTTQIYTLPGSVRAVEEYMEEILATLEHVVFMVRGLDVH